MAHYLKSGSTFRVFDNDQIDLTKTLPAQNYIVVEDTFSKELFLERVDNFEIPSKLYVGIDRRSTRILDTYLNRNNTNTGVLLSGTKGSGKTLLSKVISNVGSQKYNLPTILINKAWKGDAFNKLIQTIDSKAIIIFDEFDKTYDYKSQQEVLTLLDGVYSGSKLFILTVNNVHSVSEYLQNRPGRLYYHYDYSGLNKDFITEYCNDNLVDTSHIHTIIGITGVFPSFNFDMLKALVEEMNRYNESPIEVLEHLNVKVNSEDRSEYDVTLFVNGNLIPINWIDSVNQSTKTLNISPLSIFYIHTYLSEKDFEEEENYITIEIRPEMLTDLDKEKQIFTFYNQNKKAKLVLQRSKQTKTDLWKLF